jgi:L-ascorbate metabolism protein UlaG (beta-lactamase superfamily)
MKILFLRNASLIIQSDAHSILLDPMLGDKGSLPPFSLLRHEPVRNPLVPLPVNADISLASVNAALITHCKRGHFDHLDRAGMRFLARGNVPTYCRGQDTAYLHKRGIEPHRLITGARQPFLGGHITPIPARHGHGWISSLMGKGVGYFIELPNEPSLYIAGDTVLTDNVRATLTERKPDIAIVAAGNASVDVGQPILMSLDEVMEFVDLAPGQVVANHLEALNHCPLSRSDIAEVARAAGHSEKLLIPNDGDWVTFS